MTLMGRNFTEENVKIAQGIYEADISNLIYYLIYFLRKKRK
jgi:hypothetical protein